jgi:hypothetical protein
MTSFPFTLTRTTEAFPCAKCQAQLRRNERHGIESATYVLKQGASQWYLCSNHAAAASWAHGIKCPMNPEGKSLVNTKE